MLDRTTERNIAIDSLGINNLAWLRGSMKISTMFPFDLQLLFQTTDKLQVLDHGVFYGKAY
jgi:hypothetical protein